VAETVASSARYIRSLRSSTGGDPDLLIFIVEVVIRNALHKKVSHESELGFRHLREGGKWTGLVREVAYKLLEDMPHKYYS
jgi:hypothetical protein